jgi:hypothetical protein
MKLLTGAAHNDWMNYVNGLNTSLQSIQATDDIEVQREAFSALSDNLYKSIKAYGLGGKCVLRVLPDGVQQPGCVLAEQRRQNPQPVFRRQNADVRRSKRKVEVTLKQPGMPDSKNYIPALKYDWLTRIYDPVLQLTMPERKFKNALINQMNLQANDKVLDFGCGSLTLSIMAARKHMACRISWCRHR